MNTLQLFGSLRSPFVRRIRVLLEELRLEYAYEVLDVFQPTPSFLAHAPLERVPLLVVDHATTLHDSHEIQAWLASTFSHHELFSGGHGGTLRRLSLSSLATGIMDLSAARFMETLRAPAHQNEANLIDFENAIRKSFTLFEQELSGEHPFLSGAVLRAEDVDLVVAAAYCDLRIGEALVNSFPRVRAVVGRVAGRTSFVKTKPVL